MLSQKTKQGRADTLNKAIKYCNDAISFSNSKVANPFFNRGVIFAMLGDRERAISDFEYAKQIALGIQNDSDLYNSAEKEIEKIKSIEKEKKKAKESKTTKCLQDSSDSSCTDPSLYDPDHDPPLYEPNPDPEVYNPPVKAFPLPQYCYNPPLVAESGNSTICDRNFWNANW